jgi:hypothetical protein
MTPAALTLFAWQSAWVFTLRSMQLWADPAKASGALTEMALEKQLAFSRGMMAASRAALRGAQVPAVAAAALAPSRRCVAANVRKLRG